MRLHDIYTVDVFHRTAPNRDIEWVEDGGFNSISETVRRFSNGQWEVFDNETQSWLVIIRESVVKSLEAERNSARKLRLS